jgi:3-deoxy-D-manno-octulosonate 8-phosphate phosphatase (KDO 8-P phosphatase)
MRTANVKDGLAIRLALQKGIVIGVITGGGQQNVKLRHQKLGIEYYYDNVRDKTTALRDFMLKTGIECHEILFMGDDLVDYSVMKIVGMPACPSDAVPEIKSVSRYISDRKGGEGCVRDVIEQVLRASGKWSANIDNDKHSF